MKKEKKGVSKCEADEEWSDGMDGQVAPYSVLVDDVDDNDKPAILLAVVDEGHPPDLHVPLEHLRIQAEAAAAKEEEEEKNPNP